MSTDYQSNSGNHFVLSTPVTYAYGRFHVRGTDNTLLAKPWKPIDDATAFGMEQTALTIRSSAYGIWAKSHYVVEPFKHAAIRIVPRNQAKWLATPNPWHVYFAAPKMKRYGDLAFATIGGGPSGGWGTLLGYLETRFNSQTDIDKNTVDRAQPLGPGVGYWEDVAITNLFNLASTFDNETLDYEPTPGSSTDGYNSNSYLHGLLKAAWPNVTLPSFTSGEPSTFPGWSKPVPAIYFGVQP